MFGVLRVRLPKRTRVIGATVPAAGAGHRQLPKEAMSNRSANLPRAVTSLN